MFRVVKPNHFLLTVLLEPTLGLSELIPGLYISYSFLLMLFRVWAAFSQLGQLGESQSNFADSLGTN